MGYQDRNYAGGYLRSWGLPQGTSAIMAAGIIAYVFFFLTNQLQPGLLSEILFFSPGEAIGRLQVWRFLTHSVFVPGIVGLLFWLLSMYFFGPMVETAWGMRRFVTFYFGASAFSVLVGSGLAYALHQPQMVLGGASLAFIPVLAAAATLFPDQQVIVFFFPVKLKWLAIGYFLIFTFSSREGGMTNVSALVSLTALLTGFFYARSLRGKQRKTAFDFGLGSLRTWYAKWKRDRARKRFEVYLRKQNSGRPN